MQIFELGCSQKHHLAAVPTTCVLSSSNGAGTLTGIKLLNHALRPIRFWQASWEAIKVGLGLCPFPHFGNWTAATAFQIFESGGFSIHHESSQRFSPEGRWIGVVNGIGRPKSGVPSDLQVILCARGERKRPQPWPASEFA